MTEVGHGPTPCVRFREVSVKSIRGSLLLMLEGPFEA